MTQEITKRFAGPNGDIPRPDPVDIPPALDRELPIRIAVLAEGAITPLGNCADETWKNYLAMRTGIERNFYHPYHQAKFDKEGKEVTPPQIRATTAGTIRDFDPKVALVDKGIMPFSEVMNKMDPYATYALVAAFEALFKVKTEDGIDLLVPRLRVDGSRERNRQWIINNKLVHPLHFPTFVGTGFGGGDVSAEVSQLLKDELTPADHMMRSLADRAASVYTQASGSNGGAEADTAACASSGKALLNAMLRILGGFSEVAMVIGTEGILSKPIATAMFDAYDALDKGEDPLKVSRSLHRERRGFTIAEGALAFIISDYDWARRNRIPILYEIVGFGDTSGGGHNTNPNTVAQELAMRFARRRAERRGPIEGKIINSGHYTGTPAGDSSEILGTQNVLEDKQDRTIIFASKRPVGHMLGAAGHLSQFVAGRALQEGVVPGMIFDGEIMDEAYGWDIPRETRPESELTDAVVNQFGFGDANVSIWLRKAS